MTFPSVQKSPTSLDPADIFLAASRLYAAYLNTGRITNGQEEQWMKRCINEMTLMAKMTVEMTRV
jgi:hypothetical protein